MKRLYPYYLTFLFVLILLGACKETPIAPVTQEEIEVAVVIDHLPSWNDSQSKSQIIAYVDEVTNRESSNFIPVADRIAVFDNDGTLWSEQPAYFQLFFAMDRIRSMAPDHPEWKNKQPFKAVLENDMEALGASGEKGLVQVVMASHSGMNTDEFDQIVREWIKTAKHPTKQVTYDQLVFQPMLARVFKST
jgi:hypothetical protein